MVSGRGIYKEMRLAKNRRSEWPVVRFWYTKKKGQTVEEIIKSDITFFEWMVSNFQNVTPQQARVYNQLTNKKLPTEVIQDVEPYEWQKGDPEALYTELCKTQDLRGTIAKYRGQQLTMF